MTRLIHQGYEAIGLNSGKNQLHGVGEMISKTGGSAENEAVRQ